MALDHTTSRTPNGVTVKLSGRLTMAENDAFRAIVSGLQTDGPSRIVIDMSGLNVVDSTGLSMLIVMKSNLAAARLSLRSPNPTVARMLEICQFHKIIEIE